MRKFEIPYNYDLKFIDRLAEKIMVYKSQIEYVYLPCWEEDGLNTRMEYDQYKNFHPQKRSDYEKHIKRLGNLGIELNILFQCISGEDISIDTIKYYEAMGVNSFTTNSNMLACKIKDYNNKLVTIASVTKLLSFEDYFQSDLSMYDYSVLQFPFERGLKAVNLLPKSLKYMIIVNNFGCVYNCNHCLEHWKTGIAMCNELRTAADGEKYKCGIYPKELIYFDEYIQCYKLAGRELNTDSLMNYIDYYLNPKPEEFFRRKRALLNTACIDGTINMSKGAVL